MKNLFVKTSLICLMAALFMGCDPTKNGGVGDFNLELKTVEADFIELNVTAPSEVEIAYAIFEEAQVLTPAVLFVTGEKMTVNPGDVVKISDNIFQNKSYYLYAAAKLDAQNYSKIVSLEFTTKEYQFDELLTVVERKYDGYKIHVTVPEEVKERGNVIRYAGSSLALYNSLVSRSGSEESTVLNAVVANGNRHGNFIKNDSTIVRDNSNIVVLDENGDPVLDEYGQQIDIHDPISPAEPTVFLAGECRWGTDDEMSEIVGFSFGVTDCAYVVPLYDWDKVDPNFDWTNTERDSWEGSGWTGAFQKKVFLTKEPALCDATVEIDIPEDEITVTDAMVYFTMGEGVYRYFYMIIDNSTYNQVIDIYLNGDEDAYQWFLTSYIAFYEWGIGGMTENTSVHAAASFNDYVLQGGETYHVLCTVMGDAEGATQRFIHKEFKAKEKTKKAPVIEVKSVETGDPYSATFNIKAPNKDITGAYWACNYSREFQLMLNGGYTYETLLKGNYMLTAEDLALLNSDAGLEWSFPTLDGEVTRFAIYGCNDEYTFNSIDKNTEGKGWADYIAPMAPKSAKIDSPLYAALEGDWTATATMKVNEQIDEETVVSREKEFKSKVNISTAAPALPAKVDEYIYDLYTGSSRDDVDSMFEELVDLSNRFTEYRLEGQNRMLCSGFMDFDYYAQGRMTFKSPYDLFQATDYNSVDVPQLMYDFGPKWFLEVRPDGKVIVPFSSAYLPPMHAWPGYPFYVGGVGAAGAFYDANENIPGFPVEVSADYNTITIKPIVLEDGSYYMNALGMSGQTGEMELIGTVISDIVLTKGWAGTKSASVPASVTPSSTRAVTIDGRPLAELPKARVYKSMTKLEANPIYQYKADETPNVVTMDMVNATVDKYLEYYNLK